MGDNRCSRNCCLRQRFCMQPLSSASIVNAAPTAHCSRRVAAAACGGGSSLTVRTRLPPPHQSHRACCDESRVESSFDWEWMQPSFGSNVWRLGAFEGFISARVQASSSHRQQANGTTGLPCCLDAKKTFLKPRSCLKISRKPRALGGSLPLCGMCTTATSSVLLPALAPRSRRLHRRHRTAAAAAAC